MPPARHLGSLLAVATMTLAAGVVVLYVERMGSPAGPVEYLTEAQIRERLFTLVQPISLANCNLERFGEDYDGGYLLCGNLLNGARVGYSYGIGGYDGWGCEVSTHLGIPVHQYDCFDTRRPVCPGADTRFHEECIGGARRVEEGRLFETIAQQVAANGDSGKRLVMKIDVEGGEWDTLLNAPDDLFQRVDQLVVEFHGVEEERYLAVLNRLRTFFYVAHLHYNNNSCTEWILPFPAWVYEVLFVNKRLGVPDSAHPSVQPDPLDMPNNPEKPDCQAAAAAGARTPLQTFTFGESHHPGSSYRRAAAAVPIAWRAAPAG